MKKITLSILPLFFISFSAVAAANGEKKLEVATDGYIVTVLNFQDGDEIRLFEAETGTHILSKTRGSIDLSQLPNGSYILENTNGKTTTIERTEIALHIAPPLGTAYVVTQNAADDIPEVEQLEELRLLENRNVIDIKQEGNIITVVDFEEGDAIKLFEIKGTVHVLTKTSGVIDLTQLQAGQYFIENNEGAIALIEKLANEEDQQNTETSYLYAAN